MRLPVRLGLRAEQWRAAEGYKVASGGQRVVYPDRQDTWLSPKAAVGYQAAPDWTLKLASGRAVRSPRFATAFALAAGEQAVCFVSIGSARTSPRRGRGMAADFLADWTLPPP